MEQLNLSQRDLAKVIGFDSRVSELFSRKRKLTLKMIRNLHKELNIPFEALLAEY
jgi:HTH-type transcriptional regulator/antitoxin HigA